jgi:transmembrane sensor
MTMKNCNVDKLFREKVDQITGLPQSVSWNEDKGWRLYQEQFQKEKPKRINLIISFMSAAAVLAIALITLFLNPYSKNKTVVEQNMTAEIRQISLPDGNKVWLNSNSSIEYQTHLSPDNFEISVKGEIYIEIKNLKYERYTLKAYNAISVVQKVSSINIKANPLNENIDISVDKGAVKVYEAGSPNGLALLVIQGNYCSVHKSQKLIYASAIINNNYMAWKTGVLVFENQSIATVIDILSEYYNTAIEISDKSVANCIFSGTFEKATLNKVLNKIQTDLKLEIKYTGTKITISGIGC